MVPQLGGWARCYQLLIVKTHDVTKYLTKSRTWTGPLAWEGMDWIALAHDGDIAVACYCGNKPSGFIEYRKFLNCMWTR